MIEQKIPLIIDQYANKANAYFKHRLIVEFPSGFRLIDIQTDRSVSAGVAQQVIKEKFPSGIVRQIRLLSYSGELVA